MAKAKISNVDMLNAIRTDASTEYQNRIPVATQQNITKVGNAILDYQPTRNEFLNALMNRIGLVLISNKLFKNPLREFKRGMLEYGADIEEIFVEIAKAQSYDPEKAETEVFKRVIPDVKAYFHRLNRKDLYKQTISTQQLRTAFLSSTGINDLVGKVVDGIYSGANLDEFLIMKKLVTQYVENKYSYDVQVDALDDNAKISKFVETVREYVTTLPFMSNMYNSAGVNTFTDIEDQIILMTPKTRAKIDVNVLAMAFNIDKADLLSRIVTVDYLGDNTVAVLCDKNFYMIFDQLQRFEEIYNPQGMYWNYFFHVWQVCSTSRFSNFIRFTTDTVTPPTKPSVTSVTINSGEDSVEQGGTSKYGVDVVVKGDASEEVVFSLMGNLSIDTKIDNNGNLTVANDEPIGTNKLKVIATSVVDSSKKGEKLVTVTSKA